MGKVFKQIQRYLHIYCVFLKNCLIAQMEYRTNFFISISIECALLLAKILYIIVVFKAGVSINGLTPYAILMFIGSYTIMTGVMAAFYQPNVAKIPQYVRDGGLDIYITKPISLQFLVSFRYFDFGLAIPNVLAGLVMIIVAWGKLHIAVNFTNIASYTYYTMIGILITYPVLYIPALLSFWIVKTQFLYDTIWALWEFNYMPMGIYVKWLQRFGIYVIPIFLITNFAPMVVMNMLKPIDFIWSIIAPVIFITIFRMLWKVAIRSYSSASS